MPSQSKLFRSALVVVCVICLVGGVAVFAWMYSIPARKHEVHLTPSGEVLSKGQVWTEGQQRWARIGYVQIAAGVGVGIFLFLTYSPYRYSQPDVKPLVDFKDDGSQAVANAPRRSSLWHTVTGLAFIAIGLALMLVFGIFGLLFLVPAR